MQLPRGRFERFVRDVTIRDIHDELVEKKFSGCCLGIFGEVRGELIFENGDIILAESQENKGSKVLPEIFSNSENLVTVELSVYSESQTKLAKEFNPKFVISQKDYNAAVSSICNRKSGEKSEHRTEEKTTVKSPEIEPASNIEDKNPDEEEDEFILSINESEIEDIKTNFHENAKEILKRIHLDHLIKNEKSGDKEK